MDSSKFLLSNHTELPVSLSLEPEGSVHTLHPREEVEIETTGEQFPSIELRVHNSPLGLSIGIWPFHGDYRVLSNGEEII
jgi:hypothetical protein